MTPAALWTKHRGIARGIAADYHLPGGDRDDVRQEADIALWEAATHYRRELGPFPTFARHVVRARLTDRLRAATREKRRVLSDAVRDLEAVSYSDPVEERARVRALTAACRDLNESDRAVVARIVNDVPRSGKADDSQRYRVRRKLKDAS